MTDFTAPTDVPSADRDAVLRILQTTRSVRRRLDTDRPVDLRLVHAALEAALQASNGSNEQPWHWIVVTDPARRTGAGPLLPRCRPALSRGDDTAGGGRRRRPWRAERVPAADRGTRPGAGDDRSLPRVHTRRPRRPLPPARLRAVRGARRPLRLLRVRLACRLEPHARPARPFAGKRGHRPASDPTKTTQTRSSTCRKASPRPRCSQSHTPPGNRSARLLAAPSTPSSTTTSGSPVHERTTGWSTSRTSPRLPLR
ncbi:nitroreductase family protein [Streptomyces ambofaciens]|uniref:nitroreductase family protein n=1 Tax=Streptomyces ambofaciens TaxID=1889 RepID=UPI000D1A76C8